MPPILVPSSAERIATQILVIAQLNEREDFILRCSSRNYLPEDCVKTVTENCVKTV